MTNTLNRTRDTREEIEQQHGRGRNQTLVRNGVMSESDFLNVTAENSARSADPNPRFEEPSRRSPTSEYPTLPGRRSMPAAWRDFVPGESYIRERRQLELEILEFVRLTAWPERETSRLRGTIRERIGGAYSQGILPRQRFSGTLDWIGQMEEGETDIPAIRERYHELYRLLDE